jgi:hypothetical protein
MVAYRETFLWISNFPHTRCLYCPSRHYILSYQKKIQEILGRTNRLSFEMGPHRKQRLQQFFAAAGNSLPGYLATMRASTDTRVEFCCIRRSGNVFTKPLPSNERSDTFCLKWPGGRDLWSMPLRWAQVPWYNISFIKICSGIQNGGQGVFQTHRQHGDHIRLLSLFQNKERNVTIHDNFMVTQCANR